jgi:TatD DNase family protein
MVAVTQHPLVDFHCHVDLYEDHAALIAECESLGVYTLAVTTTPKAWRRNREFAAGSKFVRVALGLHPQLVAERAAELAVWKEFLAEARYVGEVGLDAGPRFFRSLGQQKEIFSSILRECDMQGGKILSVHSIRAVKAVLDLVETHLRSGRTRIVLHWFTGTPSEARRAVNLGCYFSINAAMLDSDRHRTLVTMLPTDRLLTETDGPFTKFEGRVARPRDVQSVLASLASVRGVDPHAMTQAVARNLRSLLAAEKGP